jgi:hypothetical protein
MELESGSETDNAFGDQGRRFGKRMGCLKLGIRELIQTAGRPSHRFFANQARQRLSPNPLRREVPQPQHSTGFQEIKCAMTLRDYRHNS